MDERHLRLVENPKPPHGLDVNILRQQTKGLHGIALLLTHLEDAIRLINEGSVESRETYAHDIGKIRDVYTQKFEADLIELNNTYGYYFGRPVKAAGEGYYWRLGQLGVEEIGSNARLDFEVIGGFAGFERFNSEGLCMALEVGGEALYLSVGSLEELAENRGFT